MVESDVCGRNVDTKARLLVGSRVAGASGPPRKDDEGIKTLFSLSLGSQCLSVLVSAGHRRLDRAPRYLINGLARSPFCPPATQLPRPLVNCQPWGTGSSLPVWTLSSQALTLTDSQSTRLTCVLSFATVVAGSHPCPCFSCIQALLFFYVPSVPSSDGLLLAPHPSRCAIPTWCVCTYTIYPDMTTHSHAVPSDLRETTPLSTALKHVWAILRGRCRRDLSSSEWPASATSVGSRHSGGQARRHEVT